MKLLVFFFLFTGNAFAKDKLLDKIAAVINSKVYTLSQVIRVKETIDARKEISPFLYNQDKYNDKEVLQILINTQIIREKISELGYVISDDSVESRIKLTEQKLGLDRKALLEFLKLKGINFEEYFEIIREAMEFNIFNTRIIAPLISISEQDLKNEFYRMNSANKALTFKYELVDFYFNRSLFPGDDFSQIGSILKDYQISGRLPEAYRSMESTELNDIKEDGMRVEIVKALKSASQGDFASPVILGDSVHVFYVKKKDIVESSFFTQAKEALYSQLFMRKSSSVTKNWFERIYSDFYIKYYL